MTTNETMPDQGWVSEYDDCLFFDNEENARFAGYGKLTRYIRADTVSAAVREAVEALAAYGELYDLDGDHSR